MFIENIDKFENKEICGALYELSKRKGSNEIDWNDHELIKKSIEILKK